MDGVRLILGDCREILPKLEAGSVDAVVADPPYPCIDRPYGRWTEAEWFALMDVVVPECRRVLRPQGSAVFVLQPNSERVGRMRTWLWDFLAKWGREWGVVQDAYWWNPATLPTIHCQQSRGGLRPSVKACVWLGEPDCYKNQSGVLWTESDAMAAESRTCRALRYYPSGQHLRRGRMGRTVDERGGVTPFNLLPVPNADSQSSAGAHGHGAGTPLALCRWWVRYISPPGGTVLDPFGGSGTVGLAARREGRQYVGIERVPEYHAIAERRLRNAFGPLFANGTPEEVPCAATS